MLGSAVTVFCNMFCLENAIGCFHDAEMAIATPACQLLNIRACLSAAESHSAVKLHK